MTPASWRILAEDGSSVNIVDLLGGGMVSPVSEKVYDIYNYSPRSGRVIGEDGRLYNLVDLLANGGGMQKRMTSENIRIEVISDNLLRIYQGSAVLKENGEVFVFDDDMDIGYGNLDSGGVFGVGNDYCIFIDNTNEIVISTEKTLAASRNIGGFHYGVNRRANAALQPINTAGVVRGEGWEANVFNGIVPRSVWTFQHRPKCNPDGMAYLASGVWVDIYQASADSAGLLVSKHNALPVTGDAEMNWYKAVERLLVSGKRLLSYQEWIQAAMGSPPGASSGNLNAWTTGSERQVTGYVERAVSSVGCRDCVGNVWEWLSDFIASGSGTEMWQDPMPGQGQGQMWIFENNNFRALLAGGSHYNGSLVGARSASILYAPWSGHISFGARGACEGI